MNYAMLDSGSNVTQVTIYTDDQYAELTPAFRAQIISCPDDIVVGCQLTPTGWVYPSEQFDATFAANPSAYIENKCAILDNDFLVILANGFTFTDGKKYKGDIKSQLWAIGFMFAMVNGLMQPPVNWISMDNSVTQFPTTQSFAAFIAFFLNWGQQVTFANFTAKMTMRSKTIRADVDAVFNAYLTAAGLSS